MSLYVHYIQYIIRTRLIVFTVSVYSIHIGLTLNAHHTSLVPQHPTVRDPWASPTRSPSITSSEPPTCSGCPLHMFFVGNQQRNHQQTPVIPSSLPRKQSWCFGFGNGEAVKTWLRLKQMQQRNHHQPRPMHQKRSCPPSSGPSNSASILAICWQGWKAHSQLPCTDNRNKSSSKETATNPFLLQVWEQNKCKKLSFWGSSTHILCWHLLSNLESLVQESPTSIINHRRWSSPTGQWEQRTFPLQVLCGDVQLCLNPPGKWSSCRLIRTLSGLAQHASQPVIEDAFVPHITLDYNLASETPKTKKRSPVPEGINGYNYNGNAWNSIQTENQSLHSSNNPTLDGEKTATSPNHCRIFSKNPPNLQSDHGHYGPKMPS